MRTTAASGAGEPPEREDYDAPRTLPRSGLLEPIRIETTRRVVLNTLFKKPGG
jgi:hypothetical protein